MPTAPPPDPHRRPGYGVVEPTDGRGVRFVAFGLTPQLAAALCAEARRLGIPATSTAGWLTQSESH